MPPVKVILVHFIHLILLEMKMYIGPNDNLLVQDTFQGVYQGTFLSQQKFGNLRMYLQGDVRRHHLTGLSAHIMIDIVANRAPGFEITLALTVKTRFTEHAIQGLTRSFSRHFNQSQLRHGKNVGLAPVFLKGLFECIAHSFSIRFFLHVNKINDNLAPISRSLI